MWLAKKYKLQSIMFHLADSRENAHKFYIMYIELSNSSLDIVKRWQECQKERDELFKTIHSSK
jgi:predicted DNA-binding WGR domain protein